MEQSERAKEIETMMLQELAANGWEDTPDNRHAFLSGLNDAWKEDDEDLDTDQAFEKCLYLIAINGMIFIESMKMNLPTTVK